MQVKTAKLPGLVALLLLFILLLVACFMKDYNPGLQREAEGFTNLKKDFLELQKEFNSIDSGWTYQEGCRGKGGVYNDDEASSCRFILYRKELLSSKGLRDSFDQYLTAAKQSGVFTQKNAVYTVPWSASDTSDKTPLRVADLVSSRFSESTCEISETLSEDRTQSGILLECNHASHYFHYPRYDR